MLIQVTQEHIDKGRRSSSCFCPVALAIKDKLPTKVIKVGYNFIYLFNTEEQYIEIHHQDQFIGIRNSPKVHDFIDSFDRGRFVQPFSFELEV